MEPKKPDGAGTHKNTSSSLQKVAESQGQVNVVDQSNGISTNCQVPTNSNESSACLSYSLPNVSCDKDAADPSLLENFRKKYSLGPLVEDPDNAPLKVEPVFATNVKLNGAKENQFRSELNKVADGMALFVCFMPPSSIMIMVESKNKDIFCKLLEGMGFGVMHHYSIVPICFPDGKIITDWKSKKRYYTVWCNRLSYCISCCPYPEVTRFFHKTLEVLKGAYDIEIAWKFKKFDQDDFAERLAAVRRQPNKPKE